MCLGACFPLFTFYQLLTPKTLILFKNYPYSTVEKVAFTFTAQKGVKYGKNRLFLKESENLNHVLKNKKKLSKIGPELDFWHSVENWSMFPLFLTGT